MPNQWIGGELTGWSEHQCFPSILQAIILIACVRRCRGERAQNFRQWASYSCGGGHDKAGVVNDEDDDDKESWNYWILVLVISAARLGKLGSGTPIGGRSLHAPSECIAVGSRLEKVHKSVISCLLTLIFHAKSHLRLMMWPQFVVMKQRFYLSTPPSF